MKYFLGCLGIIAALAVIGVGGRLLWVAMFPVHTFDNLVHTAYDAQDKTLNADNAIYNYEWFKQQYEDIGAIKNKIIVADASVETFKQSAGERSTWTFEDKTEFSRLSAVSQGLRSQLEDVIATYNARGKMANRAIFKDSIVPSYIDALTFIKK